MRRIIRVIGAALVVGACSSPHHAAAPTATSGPTATRPTTSVPAPGVAASACRAPRDGRVAQLSGNLRMVGGLDPGRPQPVAGTVLAVRSSGEQCGANAARDGSFAMQLLPGTYTLTGRSPSFNDGKYECDAPHAVIVDERPMTSQGPPPFVDVICPMR